MINDEAKTDYDRIQDILINEFSSNKLIKIINVVNSVDEENRSMEQVNVDFSYLSDYLTNFLSSGELSLLKNKRILIGTRNNKIKGNFQKLNNFLNVNKVFNIAYYKGGIGSGKTTLIEMYLKYLEKIDKKNNFTRIVKYIDITQDEKLSSLFSVENGTSRDQTELPLVKILKIIKDNITPFLTNGINLLKENQDIRPDEELSVLQQILTNNDYNEDKSLEEFLYKEIEKQYYRTYSEDSLKIYFKDVISIRKFIKSLSIDHYESYLRKIHNDEYIVFMNFFYNLIKNISDSANANVFYFKYLKIIINKYFHDDASKFLLIIDNFDICNNVNAKNILHIARLFEKKAPFKMIIVLRKSTWIREREEKENETRSFSIKHGHILPFDVIYNRISQIKNQTLNKISSDTISTNIRLVEIYSVAEKIIRILDEDRVEKKDHISKFVNSLVGSNIRKALSLSNNWFKISTNTYRLPIDKTHFLCRSFVNYPSGTYNYFCRGAFHESPEINSVFNSNSNFNVIPLLKLHILIAIDNHDSEPNNPLTLSGLIKYLIDLKFYSLDILQNTFVDALNDLLELHHQLIYTNQLVFYDKLKVNTDIIKNDLRCYSDHELYLTSSAVGLLNGYPPSDYEGCLYDLSFISEIMADSVINFNLLNKELYFSKKIDDKFSLIYKFCINLFLYELYIIFQSIYNGSNKSALHVFLYNKTELISYKILKKVSETLNIIIQSVLKKPNRSQDKNFKKNMANIVETIVNNETFFKKELLPLFEEIMAKSQLHETNFKLGESLLNAINRDHKL